MKSIVFVCRESELTSLRYKVKKTKILFLNLITTVRMADPSCSATLSLVTKYGANPNSVITSNSVQLWVTDMNTEIGKTPADANMDAKANTDIGNMNTCVNSLSTNIVSKQLILDPLLTTIQTQEEDLQVAKDRASLLHHPEKNASIHSSWFPLLKPIQTTTFLILLIFALFFTTVAFGMLMKELGFYLEIGFLFPTLLVPGLDYTTLIITVLSIIIAISIGVIVYLYTK